MVHKKVCIGNLSNHIVIIAPTIHLCFDYTNPPLPRNTMSPFLSLTSEQQVLCNIGNETEEITYIETEGLPLSYTR